MTQLLYVLQGKCDAAIPGFPRSAKALHGNLTRLSPPLRSVGVLIEMRHVNRQRNVALYRAHQGPRQPVATVAAATAQATNGTVASVATVAFIERSRWHKARMQDVGPHWYVRRSECDEGYQPFLELIERDGEDRKYGTRRYLDIGRWTYWTNLHDKEVINRADIATQVAIAASVEAAKS
jgi:hypothetical protein